MSYLTAGAAYKHWPRISDQNSDKGMGDDRPFVCSAPGCGQRFTNEDHLAVHKHKHEMTLKFGPARTDSVIIQDQTPTPTRFLKNCEEVGLFNELASSFEHEFKKGTEEEDDKKSAGPLDMSLPSTPDIKIKEEEPVEVDSSPPDSPRSLAEEKVPPKPQVSSTPTPTIVRPGSLPLHMGYDPLHPTLPSPTSVITQAPPSNRQLGSPGGSMSLMMHLGSGQNVPFLPGPHVQMPSVISLARPMNMVPNIPGIPGPPVIGGGGHISPSGLSAHTEAKLRLKASLTHQVPSSLNGGMAMVASRPEQSQILVQHPDAPSPAQPQVSPAQPTPSTGGRRRRATDEDPDERRQRFLERNRAAASRCRQKRKVWVCSLEKKAEELTSQNVQLSNEVTLLRNEVAQLKQLLLAHKDCPVTALQKKNQVYLENLKDNCDTRGSPGPVSQHSSLSSASPNGLRSPAEHMATSMLTQMASQRTDGHSQLLQSHVIMSPQSQAASR
ncbi:cyclic AMP-dependent transcription factor ATF-7-like isoform X2 [Bufo gargarizans]|uniref:cyclic AMP-dependent transcription factor ATF-7-like isoform X2 n=1 Tax=Bufo gargarizans TaxID=30331 RepID=UPI001CF3A925|nr:cyclic AMP-dependent transcription factor ATF-7-like isoform X2 [Bufo gargarizans]